MKLAIGLSYFNNVKELPRLLDPIHKHVDLIIGIDGRYPLFKWKDNISTDGSTALLIEKYNAVVEINKSPVEQIDKRNQYLEIAENAGMDFVIVLDSDEYIHPEYQDWERFKKELAKLPKRQYVANMWAWIKPEWVKNHNTVADNTWHRYTKIIRPDKVRYKTTHYSFVRKNDKKYNNRFVWAETDIDGVRMTADSLLRSKEYIQSGYNWAEQQIKEEGKRLSTINRQYIKMLSDYHKRQVKKILAMPDTVVIEDNSKLTKNL